MSITEAERHQLYTRLEEVLGPDEATSLMEHLPPVGWADVATKRDLDHFATQLRAEMTILETNLRAEIATLGSDLRSEMATFGSDLRSESGKMEKGLRGEIAELRVDMHKMGAEFSAQLHRQTYSIIGAVATMGTLVAVVSRLV